jgi:hypothetical protein
VFTYLPRAGLAPSQFSPSFHQLGEELLSDRDVPESARSGELDFVLPVSVDELFVNSREHDGSSWWRFIPSLCSVKTRRFG